MKAVSFISVLALAALPLSCRGAKADADMTGRNFVVTTPESVATATLDLVIFNSASGRKTKSGFLFREDGTSGRFSARMGIPEGTSSAICYNFDMRNSFVDGMGAFDSFRIYTNDVSEAVRQRCMMNSGERLCHTPDAVICGICKGIDGAATGDCLIEAADILEHWHIEVKVDGAQYISSAGALIGGMAPDVYPGDGFRSGKSGCVWTALEVGGNCVKGDFSTFGVDSSAQESLTISIIDNSGNPILYTASSTTLFADARRSGTYSVTPAEIIVVPAPQQEPSSGGAFNPTMGEWKTDQAEIII